MIQIHIDDHFEVNGLAIHIFEPQGSGFTKVYSPDGWHRVERTENMATMPTTPFKIPREAAGPLLAALGKLLGSVENPEALRKDYDDERRRVDTLIKAVIDGAWARSTRG